MASRVKNAKSFVDTFISDQFGWFEDEPWSDDSCWSFDSPQRYFVVMSDEACGCWEITGEFMTKAELNKLAFSQFRDNDCAYGRYDNIWILDAKTNKVIKPELKLED